MGEKYFADGKSFPVEKKIINSVRIYSMASYSMKNSLKF